MSNCRAVVFNGDGTHEIRTFAKPEPPAGGAVVRVEAVGMCGSDLSQLAGRKHVPGEVAPLVAGHEVVGRVAALAEDADLGVAIGERVAVDLVLRRGSYQGRLVVYGYTLGIDDESGLWGGYGEYMAVLPGTNLMKLTESLPAEQLTLFEPLANAVHWVEMAGVRDGTSVVVQGPGHVGLTCLVAAKLAGAATVVVTGTSADGLRLEAARCAGADHTIDADEDDVAARVRAVTGGMGARVVMVCAPTSTSLVRQALDAARFGGTVLVAGLNDMAPVEVVTDEIVMKSLTVRGGSGSTESSMRKAVAYLNQGRVPTEALRGEVLGLDDFDEALTLLARKHPTREAVRVAIRHHGA